MWRLWKLVGIVVLITLLGCSLLFVFGRENFVTEIVWKLMARRARQRRVLVLCETDHQALLKAGREILSQIPQDRLNPQPDGGIRKAGNFPVPNSVEIPRAIRDIRCGCQIDYDGYLLLVLHGGMDNFGVKIYPEDYKEPDEYFKYGDRELLPGLWYYDIGYLEVTEYDKRISKLIDEHKKYTETGKNRDSGAIKKVHVLPLIQMTVR